MFQSLRDFLNEAYAQCYDLHLLSECSIDYAVCVKFLDCSLFLTPLTTLAVLDFYYIVQHARSRVLSAIVTQFIDIAVLLHAVYIVGVGILWVNWWTEPVSALLDKCVFNTVVIYSRVGSSFFLFISLLITSGVGTDGDPFVRLWMLFFLLLDTLSAAREATMSNIRNLKLLHTMLASDHTSLVLNILKIFVLFMILLNIVQFYNMHSTYSWACVGVLLVLLCARILCGSECFDITCCKMLYLTAFSVVLFYLTFFWFVVADEVCL